MLFQSLCCSKMWFPPQRSMKSHPVTHWQLTDMYFYIVCMFVLQLNSWYQGPDTYLLISEVIVEMSYKILFVILSIYVSYAHHVTLNNSIASAYLAFVSSSDIFQHTNRIRWSQKMALTDQNVIWNKCTWLKETVQRVLAPDLSDSDYTADYRDIIVIFPCGPERTTAITLTPSTSKT